MAGAYGDETAYRVVGGGSMTFAEWDADTSRAARGLMAHGVGPGDRVAIHLEAANALRWMVSYAAIHRAGGVAVPFNPQLTRPEADRMLSHSGAVVALVEETLVDRHADGRATVVAVPGAGAHPAGNGWAALLDHGAGYFQVPLDRGDLADIMYTSGTTGSPKAVAVRHDNYSMVPFHKPAWGSGVWLHASPMHTFAGLSFIYTPMKLGLRGTYLPRFDAATWLDTVESDRPGFVFLVPSMATLLLEHPRFVTADLSSIVQCTVGSAPLSPLVLEQLQEKLSGALVSNNYGMTEAGSVYCLMPAGEAVKRPGSVGKPMPPAEILCVDDDGAPVPPDVVGHVRMRIPGRPREYFGDAEATAATWVDGLLVTGDLGKLDADGYLYIMGRSKDVIIRGGNNIHPADVEYAVATHPAVHEVSVLGVPHPVLGEDVAAFVALKPGASVDADDLQAHTAELLARYKVPRHWYFVEELPRNATGKVVKDALRRQLPGATADGDISTST